jgi:hypothetical protein
MWYCFIAAMFLIFLEELVHYFADKSRQDIWFILIERLNGRKSTWLEHGSNDIAWSQLETHHNDTHSK